jgi:WG containing repeat
MKLLFAILILFGSITGSAQKKIYPYRVKDRFGYSDEKKKILIEPAFYQAWPFYDGLARVAVLDAANKIYYGYINEKGKFAIPAKFFTAFDLEDGMAIVRARSGYGVLNKKGKIVIDTAYRSIAYHANEKLYSVEGTNRNYAFFDKDGKQLFDFKYSFLGEPGDGLAPAREAGGKLYGFIDYKGTWVIQPKPEYLNARPFSEGLGSVTVSGVYSNSKNEMYINKDGKQALPELYSNAGPFKDGIASVGHTAYINKLGQRLFPRFNSTSDFRGGLSVARNTALAGSSMYVLIDTGGRELDKVVYTGGGFYFREEGNILKQSMYKYGVIDRKGKTILECKYDRLRITRNGYIYTYFQDKNYNDVITGYISEAGVEYWEN